jgi:hypothetical protein
MRGVGGHGVEVGIATRSLRMRLGHEATLRRTAGEWADVTAS